MTKTLSSLFAAALIGGLALSAPAAYADLYTFSQTGFEGGGSISGSFEGTDLNSNGWITTSEVTAFSLSFSGDSIVSDFSQGLADLYILNYIVDSQFLGDQIDGSLQEVIGTRWLATSGFNYSSGMGAGGFGGEVVNLDTGDTSRSEELVSVPVPATLWLLGLGLPMLGFTGRQRKAA